MHRILDYQSGDKNSFIRKTTHDKVTYDELSQAFIVDIGKRSWCEVYGANRFSRAIEIADMIHGNHTT